MAFEDTPFGDSRRIIGDAAKEGAERNPGNTIFAVRRLIGRDFFDQIVQDELESFPFEVVDSWDDNPLIVVWFEGKEQKFTPEQISAMVLKKMKKIAQEYT